jgi:hypothetical protein
MHGACSNNVLIDLLALCSEQLGNSEQPALYSDAKEFRETKKRHQNPKWCRVHSFGGVCLPSDIFMEQKWRLYTTDSYGPNFNRP